MAGDPSEHVSIGGETPPTRQELARLLRGLRRRYARDRSEKPPTYRELAAATGWAVGTVSDYFTGNVLAPTNRFDVLVQLLGATPAEQRALATLRDRVEEHQRPKQPVAADGDASSAAVPRQPPVVLHQPPAALHQLPPVPRQLPPPPRPFVGRQGELATLNALAEQAISTATTVMIVAVTGTAGVGKTTLALHWAHRAAERFPDGQLYLNLRGFDPNGALMDPAEAVRRLLDVLQVSAARVPADLDAQAALYRSLLADRRMLIVLDNARDAGQVRPLLPAAAGSLVLVTSRNRLTPLVAVDGARPMLLDLLTVDESRALLARRVGTERVAADPAAVDAVIAGCSRLPLALAIAAARAQSTRFPLAAVAAELGRAHGRLDALDAGDDFTEVRAVFSWSYATLGPAAARLFRLLGLHPGPDVTAAAAASLAGLPRHRTHRPLVELTRASLLLEHAPGRYVLHDLLRAYASDLAAAVDGEADRREATRRLLEHYVHSAHAAGQLLHPARDPIPMPLAAPAAGVDIESFSDHPQAMAWLVAERPVLAAVLRHAADTGFDRYAWQLSWALDTFLQRQGHWHEVTDAWQTALGCARRLDDRAGQAFAHRLLAHAHARLSRRAEARGHLRCALDLYTRCEDRIGQADTHRSLTLLCEHEGRLQEALEHAQQALDGYRAAGRQRGEAVALNALGWYHALLGHHADALACCESALAGFAQLGDRDGEAHTLDSLGYVHHQSGHHASATDCYQQARALFHALGDRYSEARVLTNLGDAHRVAGGAGAAASVWHEALDILTDLGHPDTTTVRARLRDLDPLQPVMSDSSTSPGTSRTPPASKARQGR